MHRRLNKIWQKFVIPCIINENKCVEELNLIFTGPLIIYQYKNKYFQATKIFTTSSYILYLSTLTRKLELKALNQFAVNLMPWYSCKRLQLYFFSHTMVCMVSFFNISKSVLVRYLLDNSLELVICNLFWMSHMKKKMFS